MEYIVYLLLGLTSVVGLAFVIERGIALRWRRVVPPEIETAVQSCRTPEDVPLLRRVCEQKPSPLGRLLLQAADQATGGSSEVRRHRSDHAARGAGRARALRGRRVTADRARDRRPDDP